MDISDARNKWMLKFFRELDFEPLYQRENFEAGGIEANLSHKGWPDGDIESYGEMEGRKAPILHTVEPGQKLDEKPEDAPRGARSPHDKLQESLNASDEQDWAIVTNGLTLRVLRDYYHTYTRGYVEFDLENLFTNRNYGDFRALYRLCHASRFIEPVLTEEEDEEIETPLEQLYQVALSTGVKVGQDLQENVVSALETLGNGFLDTEIEAALEEGGQDAAEEYYQDLLYVVYRLLFLMFAEQRGMMSQRDSFYTEEYSITKLRERAEQREQGDKNTDLWEGLKATFQLVGEGDERLGVPGYNGGLFDDDNIEYILNAECPNEKLLSAVDDLTHIEQEGYRQRISYADLGVEEIGAVYESLLEFSPQLAETVIELEDRTISPGSFYLDDRGMERKETGSYYTDPGLVDELIKSALKPVVEDQVDNNVPIEIQEQQLLDITVCDPACGSGAFLIAANNFLGQRLAEIRSDSLYSDERTVRQARRSVVQHCIYGVDLNPMAVELAKVSLWINSAVENKPLNFLDHRIRQGNSLIGATREVVNEGLPEDAYETSKGRDWHNGNKIRKKVRKENKGLDNNENIQADLNWEWEEQESYINLAEKIEDISEENIEDIGRKEEFYHRLQESSEFLREKMVLDVWTAAFFWPMDHPRAEYPTPKIIERIKRNPPSLTELSESNIDELNEISSMCKKAREIASRQSFFHWEIEFPEVFYGEKSGFDCVLSNPPWEELRADESEFFAVSAPEIANAPKSERGSMIESLQDTNPELYDEWKEHDNNLDRMKRFLNNSPTISKGSVGKTNTYPLFTFLNSEIISRDGRSGFVIKTALATDHDYSDLFEELVTNGRVVSLYDFENQQGYFPNIEDRLRFSLLTLRGDSKRDEPLKLIFRLLDVDKLSSTTTLNISIDELEKLSAGTYQLPNIDSNRDLQILQRISSVDSNINLNSDTSSWDIYWGIMYDSGKVQDHALIREDFADKKEYDLFECSGDGEDLVGLYEGRYIDYFDHRRRTFENVEKENRFGRAIGGTVGGDDKQDPDYEIEPRYWIQKTRVEDFLINHDWEYNWLFVYGRYTKDTNSRTYSGAFIPRTGSSSSAPLLLPRNYESEKDAAKRAIVFAAISNSHIFDYLIRNNLTGTTMGKNLITRMIVPDYPYIAGKPDVVDKVVDRVINLTYTSHSLKPLAEAVGSTGPPNNWDRSEREQLQYQLDAIVSHLYKLEKSELSDILDTFRSQKEDENEEYGYYRTKEKTIEYFEKYEEVFE